MSPLAFLALPALLAPGPSAELTLDWILDPDEQRLLSPCRFRWLPDGALLLEDPRKPESERSLERLDPSTLERKPALDAVKVLESWKAALGGAPPPRRPGFPAEVAADGKTFLHEREGDLFLIDAAAGTVRRITNTEAPEICSSFSPDGKAVAFVRENDLHLADVASGRERRLTRSGSETRLNGTLSWVYWEEIMDRRDEAYWWSPDSKAILFLESDDSPVERYPLPDHEPATPSVRWQRYPKAGGTNPVVRAGILETAGAEVRWVDLGTPAPEYIVRGGWLPDGSRAAIQTLNRAQDRLELWTVDRRSGERRRLHEERSSTWVNLHRDLHFLHGDRFLWLSEREGRRRLYLHGAEGPPAGVTPAEWVLAGGHGPGVWTGTVAWIDPAAGDIYFHAASTPGQVALHRAPFKDRKGLDGRPATRLTEGEGTHQASFSPDGRFFVDVFSKNGVPPRATLHRRDGSTVLTLSPPAEDRLAPFGLEPPRLFSVSAGDGAPLSARLFRPSPLVEGKRYPAIVYVYGGPSAPAVGDRWDGSGYLWAQLLARRGFAVFTVDPRSASDTGKAGEDRIHRRFYGGGELADILAGVRHLKSLPFIDPERVGIWGWSGGGTNTLYAMTHSREFRAGIAVAGVADQRYYDTVYTERYMGKPAENEEGYRSIAPPSAAKDLHGRLLIVHGTHDDNVHPQSAMRMAHALIAEGKQFDLMLYPRRDHGIGDGAARKHLHRLMLDFWERWLKGSRVGTF